jgi:hypothetical protein
VAHGNNCGNLPLLLIETIKAFPSKKDALLGWKLATESCPGMAKVVSFASFSLYPDDAHSKKSATNMLLDACSCNTALHVEYCVPVQIHSQ